MLPSKQRKLAGIVVDERRDITAVNGPDGMKNGDFGQRTPERRHDSTGNGTYRELTTPSLP